MPDRQHSAEKELAHLVHPEPIRTIVLEPELGTGAKLAIGAAVVMSAAALGFSLWVNKDLSFHIGRV